MTIEEALDNFWHYVKQAKSAAELLYGNTSVLMPDHESLSAELCDTNRELADLEMKIAKARDSFYKAFILVLRKEKNNDEGKKQERTEN